MVPGPGFNDLPLQVHSIEFILSNFLHLREIRDLQDHYAERILCSKETKRSLVRREAKLIPTFNRQQMVRNAFMASMSVFGIERYFVSNISISTVIFCVTSPLFVFFNVYVRKTINCSKCDERNRNKRSGTFLPL